MNRIKELRQENKFSQIELANKVHASNQAISAYESGTREPKEPMWQKLADFFNVSIDYLKGYGYSKDYIYKLLNDAYKEDYRLTFELEPPFTNAFISARDEIENYCKQNKTNIPKNVGLDFWKTNFNFIFNDKSVKRLLTTKDSYNDDDIKEIIINAIYWYGLNPHTRELVNKLNYKS